MFSVIKNIVIVLFVFMIGCTESDKDSNKGGISISEPPKYDIFIGYGQSNMVGATKSSSSLNISDVKKVSICDGDSSNSFASCFGYSNILYPSDIYGRGKYSLWPTFFQSIADQRHSNRSILINAAVGGAYLKSLTPYPHADCSKYANLIRITNMVKMILGMQISRRLTYFFFKVSPRPGSTPHKIKIYIKAHS